MTPTPTGDSTALARRARVEFPIRQAQPLSNADPMRLTLLSRAYCHLCDEMETDLRPLLGATPLEVIDVDAPGQEGLEARYGDAVPVLLVGDPAQGREVCRYRLDRARVLAALAETPEIG